MKSKSPILMIAALFFLSISCSKSDIEKGVDCVGESLFEKVKNTTDPTNPKKVDFAVEYSGTNTLQSVKWNFGDGTPAETVTATGTTVSISHIYSAAGNYAVRADITVQKGGASCTSSPTRSMTVN
jgi:PKD repeat protein